MAWVLALELNTLLNCVLSRQTTFHRTIWYCPFEWIHRIGSCALTAIEFIMNFNICLLNAQRFPLLAFSSQTLKMERKKETLILIQFCCLSNSSMCVSISIVSLWTWIEKTKNWNFSENIVVCTLRLSRSVFCRRMNKINVVCIDIYWHNNHLTLSHNHSNATWDSLKSRAFSYYIIFLATIIFIVTKYFFFFLALLSLEIDK